MAEQDVSETFLQRLLQRPLPGNSMARVRTLAKELAEGAAEGVWEQEIPYLLYGTEDAELRDYLGDVASEYPRFMPESPLLRRYFKERWNAPLEFREFDLLEINGYIIEKIFSQGEREYSLTKAAFDLIQEVEPVSVFISYRRRDSSAFALLILKSLKEAGLSAFLDMTIQPGDNWHAYIQKQVEAHDFFIVLIGKETLKSEIVHREMLWAIGSSAMILPIWHNGFVYQAAEWASLPPEIDRVLQNTHTIRVLEESALAYNNAIVELLNRFGITP